MAQRASSLYRKAMQADSHVDKIVASLGLVASSKQLTPRELLVRRSVALSLLVAVVSYNLFPLFVKADTVTMYPTACLGGWTNPKGAEGVPQTEQTASSLDLSNAAFLDTNTNADIYCGSFSGDPIPEATTPTEMTLTMYWKEGETASTTIESDSFSSSTLDILDASAAPDFNLSTSTEATDTVEDPVLQEQPTDSSSEVPVNETPVSQEIPSLQAGDQQSLAPSLLERVLSYVTPHAYAQEETPGTKASIEVDESSNESATSTDSATIQTLSNATGTTSEELDTTASPVFEVLYTLDGATWESLGKVSRDTLSYNTFVIPVTASSSWVDVGLIQVKIAPLLTSDQKPPVYIDGMKLSVTYKKSEEEVSKADPRSFDMKVATTTGSVEGVVDIDPSQGKKLTVTSQEPGSLIVYKENEDSPRYSIGIGSTPTDIYSSIFEPGNFTLYVTAREDACTGISPRECENDPLLIGKVTFTVSPTKDTPLEYVHSR